MLHSPLLGKFVLVACHVITVCRRRILKVKINNEIEFGRNA